MEEQFPDFTGQSVVFYVNTPAHSPNWLSQGITLESPSLQKQGEHYFVIGKTLDSEDINNPLWSDNRQSGIAWDSVFHYIVVPSQEYQNFQSQDTDETVNIDEAEKPSPAVCSIENKPPRKPLINLSLTVMFILIPIALLIGIIIWIIKML